MQYYLLGSVKRVGALSSTMHDNVHMQMDC